MAAIISAMEPSQRHQFADIWIPWLKGMGREPEPEDLAIMADPLEAYAKSGGAVFLAHLDGVCVGAVAVKALDGGNYEFCKLVVTENARGHGLGKTLVQACLDFVHSAGGKALYLQSFKALDVALELYAKMGFAHCPAPANMLVLDRTEVIMAKFVEA